MAPCRYGAQLARSIRRYQNQCETRARGECCMYSPPYYSDFSLPTKMVSAAQKKCPAEAGHKCGNGISQTAQSFERFKDQRPSTLGHDGRWGWIFAKRSLADRVFANRSSCRRRRLPARQIG